MDTGAALFVDMPKSSKIRLTVHIYRFRYSRIPNCNGAKAYFNIFFSGCTRFVACVGYASVSLSAKDSVQRIAFRIYPVRFFANNL